MQLVLLTTSIWLSGKDQELVLLPNIYSIGWYWQMKTKELKYINEDLPQDDKEAVSEIIYNALLEKDINFSSYSYEIHVSYSEEK